ncbi:MAG TPA: hypothetical protein VMG30_21340 [Acidobacteriota bacterium]|nr:hypothetical protein [Acidobacteriota bacterium]
MNGLPLELYFGIYRKKQQEFGSVLGLVLVAFEALYPGNVYVERC